MSGKYEDSISLFNLQSAAVERKFAMSWKEFFLQILNWCGQQSTLIVAVFGFATSIIIARLKSNWALDQELFKKWLDLHEKALRHLWKKIEDYGSMIKSMKAVAVGNDQEEQMAILLTGLQRLMENEMGDDELFGAILFYENGSSYDTQEFLNQILGISKKIKDSLSQNKSSSACDIDFNREFLNLASMLEKHQRFLIKVYNTWMRKFHRHPRIKKWVDKGV